MITTRTLLAALTLYSFVQPASSSGGSCFAMPVSFGPTCTSNTGIFGSPGHRVTYVITPISDDENSPLVCCEGRGFDGSGRETWFNLGCGFDKVEGGVNWGGAAAKPAVKCKGNPTGSNVKWTH